METTKNIAACTENCEDDDVAVLMPNVMKLMHSEADSEGSQSSTSMSLCSKSEKENYDSSKARNREPLHSRLKNQPISTQQRGHSLLREVANKFRREGASGKGCLSVFEPLELTSFGSDSRASQSLKEKPHATALKENVMRVPPAQTYEGPRLTLEQKMAMKYRPQETAKNFGRGTLQSRIKLRQRMSMKLKPEDAMISSTLVPTAKLNRQSAKVAVPKESISGQGSDGSSHFSNLAASRQRGKTKLSTKPTPLDLSELHEKFAQIDEECLQEEEESSVHLTMTKPTFSSEVLLRDAEDIREKEVHDRKSRSGTEKRGSVEASVHTKNTVTGPSEPSHGQAKQTGDVSTGRSAAGRYGAIHVVKFSKENAGMDDMFLNADMNPDSEEHRRCDDMQALKGRGGAMLEAFAEEGTGNMAESGVGHSHKTTYLRDSDGLMIAYEEVASSQSSLQIDSPGCSSFKGASAAKGAIQNSQMPTSSKSRQLRNKGENLGIVTLPGRGSNTKMPCKAEIEISPPSLARKPLAEVNGLENVAVPGSELMRLPSSENQSQRLSTGSSLRKRKYTKKENDSTANPPKSTRSTPRTVPIPPVDGPSTLAQGQRNLMGGSTNALEQVKSLSATRSGIRGQIQTTWASPPLQKKLSLGNNVLANIPLQEGTYSTSEASSTPPPDPLSMFGIFYNRRGKCIDMGQRRLEFGSADLLPLSEKVMRSDSIDKCVFFGLSTNADLVSHNEVHGSNDKLASNEQLEARIELSDDVVIGQVDVPKSCSSRPEKARYCQGGVNLEDLAVGSAAQLDNLPDFQDEASGDDIHEPDQGASDIPEVEGGKEALELQGDLVNNSFDEVQFPETQPSECQPASEEDATSVEQDDPGLASTEPDREGSESTRANGLSRVRRPKKRAKTKNLGSPLDAGTKWEDGRRVSTRIKSKPLDWWRGEKMMYGRVHSSLCTLIGIKTTSPDPVWPKPKPQRGDYRAPNYHIDSFVDDRYSDMIRLASL